MKLHSIIVIVAALILLLSAFAAACDPAPAGSPTVEPSPSQSTATAPVATDTPKATMKTITATQEDIRTPSQTPGATHTAQPTAARTWTPAASPTFEFCETAIIEYRVLVPTLYVRDGKGTRFTRVGQLSGGDTFIGSLCVDPDASNTYYWTKILEEGHQYQGQWVAYLSVDYSARFLE